MFIQVLFIQFLGKFGIEKQQNLILLGKPNNYNLLSRENHKNTPNLT